MTVKPCRLDPAQVSLARTLTLADLLIRARQHSESRALIVRALQVIVERNDSLFIPFGFQVFIGQPETHKVIFRVCLQQLFECLNARCGQGYFPPIIIFAIVCNCMFDVPS